MDGLGLAWDALLTLAWVLRGVIAFFGYVLDSVVGGGRGRWRESSVTRVALVSGMMLGCPEIYRVCLAFLLAFYGSSVALLLLLLID
ncbi:MAG: hypothetical protein M0R02_15655 [Bacteroidales bacterium]|nr:hypothetical protein [Bacteroidales bacterium]